MGCASFEPVKKGPVNQIGDLQRENATRYFLSCESNWTDQWEEHNAA